MMIEPPIQFRIDTLKIVPRREIPQPVWDAFVDISPQAWLYHTYDMQDAIATWPGKSDVSFAAVDENGEGQIVAMLPLHRINRPFLRLIRNSRLDSFGSFAFHPRLSQRQVDSVTDVMSDHLMKLARETDAETIDMTLPALTPALRGPACPRVNPLIHLGMTNTSTQTYIIDLGQSSEEIWNRMESYCRTHIRKAQKTGITVRQATSSQADLETYYTLHRQTYQRTGVAPHPFKYFESIWKNFVSNGRAVVFFAEQDGIVIAADNEAAFKKGVSGWSAAGLGSNTSGVNNLLHWTAIQWAKENAFEYYESGEGFPAEKDGKRKGLTDFKKSFGGELYPYYRGRFLLRPFLHNSRLLFTGNQ